MGVFQPNLGGLVDVDRIFRTVLHSLPTVLPLDAGDQHGGDQVNLGETVPHVPFGRTLKRNLQTND